MGSSIYIGKVAVLHNGQTLTIAEVDPDNGRRFSGKLDGETIWFTLSDIAALKG